jgi:hypothetical protein
MRVNVRNAVYYWMQLTIAELGLVAILNENQLRTILQH